MDLSALSCNLPYAETEGLRNQLHSPPKTSLESEAYFFAELVWGLSICILFICLEKGKWE